MNLRKLQKIILNNITILKLNYNYLYEVRDNMDYIISVHEKYMLNAPKDYTDASYVARDARAEAHQTLFGNRSTEWDIKKKFIEGDEKLLQWSRENKQLKNLFLRGIPSDLVCKEITKDLQIESPSGNCFKLCKEFRKLNSSLDLLQFIANKDTIKSKKLFFETNDQLFESVFEIKQLGKELQKLNENRLSQPRTDWEVACSFMGDVVHIAYIYNCDEDNKNWKQDNALEIKLAIEEEKHRELEQLNKAIYTLREMEQVLAKTYRILDKLREEIAHDHQVLHDSFLCAK